MFRPARWRESTEVGATLVFEVFGRHVCGWCCCWNGVWSCGGGGVDTRKCYSWEDTWEVWLRLIDRLPPKKQTRPVHSSAVRWRNRSPVVSGRRIAGLGYRGITFLFFVFFSFFLGYLFVRALFPAKKEFFFFSPSLPPEPQASIFNSIATAIVPHNTHRNGPPKRSHHSRDRE